MLPPDSEQLQLALDWGREPWNGWSPRMLTTSRKKFKLPEPAREPNLPEAVTDPHQLAIFLKGNPSHG